LLRHKAHVSVALAKIAQKREGSIGELIMARLEKLYQRAEKVLNDAEASGDGRLALAGIREVRETLGGILRWRTRRQKREPGALKWSSPFGILAKPQRTNGKNCPQVWRLLFPAARREGSTCAASIVPRLAALCLR
jgi:hypothetical protein